MAFIAKQKTQMHLLLGLFEGGTFDWYDYNDLATGVITSVPIHNQIDFTTATTRLATIITDIESGSDGRETEIGSVLTRFDSIFLDTAKISTGGVSSAGGVRYDPQKERRHLKKLLETMLGIRVFRRSVPQGGPLMDFSGGTGAIPVSR